MSMRSWQEMRDWMADRLVLETNHDVEWWNAEVARQKGVADEPSLRKWLAEQGVTGYPQMLLVMERFGYPDHFLASAEELIDGQYRDRPGLRPIFHAAVAVAQSFGPCEIQARKTYTSLLTPRRTFAVVKPTTRTRVDLVLRLDGVEPGGRLLDGRNAAGSAMNLRIPMESVDDLDDEAVAYFRRAYEANL